MSLQFRGRSRERAGGDEYGFNKGQFIKAGSIALGMIVFASLIFGWFACRIEVGPGQFVPLLKKHGQYLKNEQELAPDESYMGPQVKRILGEGRHFYNPWNYQWPKPIDATFIPSLQVGIKVRKYGDSLPPGQIIAEKDTQKGILRQVLRPGRHYVNTWAYDVEKHPMVRIKEGFRGVVTLLVGTQPKNPNVFVVAEGERGTQPYLLEAGTWPKYSNKYMHEVTRIDVRSQKFEYSVSFPSKFGFDIQAGGTIEWAPQLAKLPEVFVKYVDEADMKRSGGIDNIQRKIILPLARSFFRTVGGGYRAVDFITGSTRIVVQNEVEKRLQIACATEGIDIKSFVISATKPPASIRKQYGAREDARKQQDQYKQEIVTEIGSVILDGATPKLDAKGKPVLDDRSRPVLIGGKPRLDENGKPIRDGGRIRQKLQAREKDRQRKLGGVRVQIAQDVREAEQYAAVEVTKAEKDLAVTKLMLQAAKDQAAQVLAKGMAEAEVMVMRHKAEAEAMRAKVTAFKTGSKYAEYLLITKLSPAIRRILSNTEGPFADLFRRFSTQGSSVGGEKNSN